MQKLYKRLTNLYFSNKVKVAPAGAITFFGYLDKMEQILSMPNLIKLNEDDVMKVIRGAVKINIVEMRGTGTNKITNICRQIRYFLSKKPCRNIKGAFFHIIGDGDLTLYDVKRISDVFFRSTHGNENVIFGASVDASLENEVKLLLVLTRSKT